MSVKVMSKFIYKIILLLPEAIAIKIINSYLFHTSGVKISKSNKGYVAQDLDGKIIHFSSFRRSILYKDGVASRIKLLAAQYALDSIDFKPNDLVVDVGANIGEIGMYFKYFMPEIRYYGFEPNEIDYTMLCKNLDGFGFLYNKGLWKNSGIHAFYSVSETADSSFIEPANSRNGKPVYVETLTLDQLKLERIRLLKLEAEGGEPEVLEGAAESIKKIKTVIADVGFERGVDCKSTLPEVTNTLYINGFTLVDIKPGRLICRFERIQ